MLRTDTQSGLTKTGTVIWMDEPTQDIPMLLKQHFAPIPQHLCNPIADKGEVVGDKVIAVENMGAHLYEILT
jgi:hypothetical protein